MTADARNYLVFARINQGDDLKHIGSVNARTGKLARSYAKSVYDEEDWARMIVVDSTDVIEVTTDREGRKPTMLGDRR